MYQFLKGRNYTANANGSLMLKPPYDNFCISEHNVCYPNDLKDNCLTPANIGSIFEKFYKGPHNIEQRGFIYLVCFTFKFYLILGVSIQCLLIFRLA